MTPGVDARSELPALQAILWRARQGAKLFRTNDFETPVLARRVIAISSESQTPNRRETTMKQENRAELEMREEDKAVEIDGEKLDGVSGAGSRGLGGGRAM